MLAIQEKSNSLSPPIPPLIFDIVKDVAIRILKELAVALACGLVVAAFVATPSGIMFMMSAAVIQFVVSVFFHSLGAYAAYKNVRNDSPFHQWVQSICQWILGVNFGGFSGYNMQSVIHESGHAFSALLLYKRPRPSIEIYPFVGGITQFYKTTLSPFGKKLGPAWSTCLIVASGPALTLLVSVGLLAIGIALLDSHPQLGKYLIGWAGIDFLNHAQYAYSAHAANAWNLSHDFVHLSIFGLSPTVATIGILAIPLMITLGMIWQKKPQASAPAVQL